MILATQSGKHADSPLFETTRVAALAFFPEGASTRLTLDGELIAMEPLLMEVHQGLLSVVAAPKHA